MTCALLVLQVSDHEFEERTNTGRFVVDDKTVLVTGLHDRCTSFELWDFFSNYKLNDSMAAIQWPLQRYRSFPTAVDFMQADSTGCA